MSGKKLGDMTPDERKAAIDRAAAQIQAELQANAGAIGRAMDEAMPASPSTYPSPGDISYDEDSRWCQEHGHDGLLVGSVCGICDQLVATDPRFAAVLGTKHNPDGSRKEGTS